MSKVTKELTIESSLPESHISIPSSCSGLGPERIPCVAATGGGGDANETKIQIKSEGSIPFKYPAVQIVSGPATSPTINKSGVGGYLKFGKSIIGVLRLTSLLILMFFLLILSCCWYCLFRDVYISGPRTFSWEVTVQILGAYYDNCIGLANCNESPAESTSREHCTYMVSVPWIPLVQLFICISAFGTLAFVWIYRAIKRNIHLKTFFLEKTLICHCATQWAHAAYCIANLLFNCHTKSQNVRQQMKSAITRYSNPLQNDQMWDATQTERKCCGIDSAHDWISDATEDPRFPRSCCFTDTYDQQNLCKFLPTRHEIWQEGCLQKEVEIVDEYRKHFLLLLGFSWITMLLLVILNMVFERYFARNPVVEITITPKFLRKNYFSSDYYSYGKSENQGSSNMSNCADNANTVDKENTGSLVCGADYLDVDIVGAIKTKLCSSTNNEIGSKKAHGESCWSKIEMNPIYTRKYGSQSTPNEDAMCKTSAIQETAL